MRQNQSSARYLGPGTRFQLSDKKRERQPMETVAPNAADIVREGDWQSSREIREIRMESGIEARQLRNDWFGLTEDAEQREFVGQMIRCEWNESRQRVDERRRDWLGLCEIRSSMHDTMSDRPE